MAMHVRKGTRSIVSAMSVAGVAAAIALTLTAAGPVARIIPVQIAAAACTKQLTFTDHVLSGAKGGRMRWITRTETATDWNVSPGGFAAEVLWVGTDGDQADGTWVEIGWTKGWELTNTYQLYSASGFLGGNVFDEDYFASPPALGTTVTFTVRDYSSVIADSYIAEATWGTQSYRGEWWDGHGGPTVDTSGGLEATCGTSRVDRTYVSLNQYQTGGGTWTNVTQGTLHDQASVGGTAWCVSPRTFRYWLNSQIDQTLCQ
jgi:hypothetical protein